MSGRDAIQFLRLPVRLPAGRSPGALARRAVQAGLAPRRPRRPVVLLLRLLGLALHPAAGAVGGDQLGRGAGLHPVGPPHPDPGRHRRQPRRPRRLQILQLLRRSGEPGPGPARAASRYRAAARHLVLHLPPRHVPDGPEGRQSAALRSRALCPLHRLLPAGARRSARALERDHAPARRASLSRARTRRSGSPAA